LTGGGRAVGLGDTISAALSSVGITEERVTKWLGSCRCKERQERLNAVGQWATMTVKGKLKQARDYLDRLLEGDEK
jgi:hypothetical protein